MPVISSSILYYFHTKYAMNNNSIARTADYLLNNQTSTSSKLSLLEQDSSKHTGNWTHAAFSQEEIRVEISEMVPGKSQYSTLPSAFSSLTQSSSRESTPSESRFLI